jgi:bifunctional non-homologous end joining protein LigD
MALAQMAVIELHPWGATTRAIDKPDTLTFDLDPGPGVAFAALRDGALEMRARLKTLGLPGFAKVTGGKGLHVVVPLRPKVGWAEAKALCRALAVAMANDSPRRYVAVSKKSEREGRIFVDYLRNDLTATAIACWSPRARDGARIAVPVSWPLIEKARAMPSFMLREPGPALKAAAAWRDYEASRTPIAASMLRALGVS